MPKAPEARGAQLEIYSVFDFRKGLDLKTSPLQLAVQKGQNSLRMAKNMVYTSAGAVTKRFDIVKQTTVANAGSSVSITGGFLYRHSNGTEAIIVGTNDGRIMTYSAGSVTNAVGSLTSGTKWYFTQYNNLAIICNRADAPRKYNGSAFGTLGGSPPSDGGPVAHHGNRVFMLDGTNKSTLYWSALNDEEDWTTANNAGSTPIAENDGSDCMDLVPAINEMIILKGSRAYRLQGISPSTFSIDDVVPTTGSKGAISTQCSFFAVNDTWFLADNGLVNLRTTLNFGDLKSSFASDKISPLFEPQTSGHVLFNSLDEAVGCYDSQHNRIYVAVATVTNNLNDTILCLDLHTNAWSTWPTLPANPTCLFPVRNSTTGQVEIWMGANNGHLYKLNQDDDENAYTGEARHLSALGKPGLEKSPRYVYLYLKEEGDQTVTVDTKYDFGATGGQTYTASLLGGTGLLGVTWTLGVDPLGAREQIVKRIDVSGVGEFLELGVKSTTAGQFFTWYGYEVLYRLRRLVRPGTAVAS